MHRFNLVPLALAGVAWANVQKCLPGEPCFPSQWQLDAFNASVSGALLKPPSYGSVCYEQAWNATECAYVVQHKNSAEWREAQPGAVQYTQNEFDEYGNGCQVPDTVPTSPLTGQCVLGALATYIVNVTDASQVEKSISFAKAYNLNLVIKNTGHDYIGRSTETGGFTIWTEHLKGVSHITDFVPEQCEESYDVIEAGAGVNVGELYAAAEEYDVLVNGGYNPTVGAGGGYWMLGGMGSPFGPELGYGVDRIIQFTIILANGTTVTASKCQNYDLYWAVKGGGGAYGVVTKVWVLTYPKPAAVNIIYGQLNASNASTWTTLINEVVDHSPQFRAPENLTSCLMTFLEYQINLLCPKIFKTEADVVSAEQSQQVLEPLAQVPGVSSKFTSLQFPTWYEGYVPFVLPVVQEGAPTGLGCMDASRPLKSETLFTEAGRQTVKDFLLAVDPSQLVIIEWNGGFATMNYTDASIHPIWRDAVGYLVPAVLTPYDGPTTAAMNSSADAISNLLDQYIGINAYPNEDNLRSSNYTERYWGPNYPKLLSIKQQVDPDNFFTCKRCVGSEEIDYPAGYGSGSWSGGWSGPDGQQHY